MKEVLVIGSGAREHALVWKALQSPEVSQVYAAPGNPGIAEIAECLPISVTDVKGLCSFAKDQQIDLTIVGPEDSLAKGVVDLFEEEDLDIFGPTQSAARVESSKIFTKKLLEKYGILSAAYRTFHPTALRDAMVYLERQPYPLVIKEDGLAGGKGAKIVRDKLTAREIARDYLKQNKAIVVEDFLEGDEVSVTALCNGKNFIPFLLSQDHKQIYEGGENTGGMGVYAPLPFVTAESEELLNEEIVQRTLNALDNEGIFFRGVLYSNVMLTNLGPKVLEHNTRFGDPETQVLMSLLESDLIKVLDRVLADEITGLSLSWKDQFAVSLTLSSAGYPQDYEVGKVIEGVEEAERIEEVKVFHAGTKIEDGKLVSAGGRVLSVVALGNSLNEAVQRVYSAADQIHFDGKYYRQDIAKRALK